MSLSQNSRALTKVIHLDFHCRYSKVFNSSDKGQNSPRKRRTQSRLTKEDQTTAAGPKTTFETLLLRFSQTRPIVGSLWVISLPFALVPYARAYEGGMISNVWATSFSHPNLSLPKISAPGWKSFPASRRTVRTTMLSPMMV